MDRRLRSTQSLCPRCHRLCPAELFVRPRAGQAHADVWLRKSCPEHGDSEGVYWRDAELYETLGRVVGDYTWCRTFECLKGVRCDRCVAKSYNIMVEVTNRCNLDCPVCCSDANAYVAKGDPTIEQVLARLPPVEPGLLGKLRRPNVVLFGGEPTVRKDLPTLIRALVDRGYIPRLATNGTRMTDETYLDALWEAGLRWVILQFDGFDEDVSQLLRGERLHQRKLVALDRMRDRGFRVQLGTMMVKGANTRWAADILRFARSYPNVFWISFYPHSAQSRASLPTADTSVAELLDEIETHTEGRVTRADFVRTMQALALLHRLLPLPNLRQKLSTLPMVLVYEGDECFPLVRMLRPSFALRHARTGLRLIVAAARLLRYQERQAPPFIKFLVVEKFHADDTLDLEEASNCHMAFMTPEHFVPFDLYNITYKQRETWKWPASTAESGSAVANAIPPTS